MKKLLLTAVCALMVVLFITSCDKKKEELFIGIEKEVVAADMKNPRNPNDKQGELHNEFLDFFAKNMDRNKKEVTREEYSKLVQDFYAVKKLEYGDAERNTYGTLFGVFSEAGIGGPAKDWNVCKQFPVLCDITGTGPYNPTKMLDPSNGGTSYERTLKFISSIREDEEKVIGNKELSDEDRESLLSFYAVARYSAGYWHNAMYIQKQKSGWYDNIESANPQEVCHVCDVVMTDAGGAAIGSFFGGPIGAGIGGGLASAAVIIEKWFW